jgi:hypothetical protein
MKAAYLVATTHALLAFDSQDRFFEVHSGNGLYYGLAKCGGRIYVSCRNQTEGPKNLVIRDGEKGSVLVLDANSLRQISELCPDEFPLRDVHGMALFDGKLWITSSFDNMVATFDLVKKKWGKWYPSADIGARDRDVNHFNTIVHDGDRICLLAHNNGPSHILFYDRQTLELCSALKLGCQAHDIFWVDGAVTTCSSANGLLISSKGWALRTGAFPRGIAITEEGIVVGISQMAQRSDRHKTSGILRKFTPAWGHLADYVLPGVGMVLAILPLDLELSGISGLETFQAQCFRDKYNSLEPGNIYRFGDVGDGTFAPEWHAGEGVRRWTAARLAHMDIVVNPGETTLIVAASSGFPGPYSLEVLINGQRLGVLSWSGPDFQISKFCLPPNLRGTCELGLSVSHLWQPSVCLGTDDKRWLGVCVHELRLD